MGDIMVIARRMPCGCATAGQRPPIRALEEPIRALEEPTRLYQCYMSMCTGVTYRQPQETTSQESHKLHALLCHYTANLFTHKEVKILVQATDGHHSPGGADLQFLASQHDTGQWSA